jgi:hypothetical protein
MDRRIPFVAAELVLGLLVALAVPELLGCREPAPNGPQSRPSANRHWLPLASEWFDQSHLVAVHQRREAEVGDRGKHWRDAYLLIHEHMLWPNEAKLTRLAVASERTAAARSRLVDALERALKPEYVPEGLSDHLVGIRGHGTSGSDFLLGRYAAGTLKFQIIHSGRSTGVLCVPRAPAATGEATGEYALEVARAVLVDPRPQDEADLRTMGMRLEGVFHGAIANRHGRSAADPLVGPSPWHGFRTLTDGRFVFLELPASALKEDAGPPTRAIGRLTPLDETVRLFD